MAARLNLIPQLLSPRLWDHHPGPKYDRPQRGLARPAGDRLLCHLRDRDRALSRLPDHREFSRPLEPEAIRLIGDGLLPDFCPGDGGQSIDPGGLRARHPGGDRQFGPGCRDLHHLGRNQRWQGGRHDFDQGLRLTGGIYPAALGCHLSQPRLVVRLVLSRHGGLDLVKPAQRPDRPLPESGGIKANGRPRPSRSPHQRQAPAGADLAITRLRLHLNGADDLVHPVGDPLCPTKPRDGRNRGPLLIIALQHRLNQRGRRLVYSFEPGRQ